MEGAGASIVSHAAETRGMDSAYEEPELPFAVQDLIWRLEGKGEPMTTLPYLRQRELRKFFPKRASLSTITGWRSKVRLRVLEAIGNCNTLTHLHVDDIFHGDIWMLTASEREVVLRGFMSSTVIKKICLYFSSRREVEMPISDEESFCLLIGRILNSSSVQVLRIQFCKLSARCFLNLASGLRGNSDSKLQRLELLGDAWEDSSAVKHVADMINSAPRLETLGLYRMGAMEEEYVGILSQALIESTSLKQLWLDQVEWGAALLLKALAGDDGNRSIERLRLENMYRLGGSLREVLTSSPSLKEVRLWCVEMSPEEWHQLGEVIRDQARATYFTVQFLSFEWFEWESIEALACAASSEVKDPVVDLALYHPNEDKLMLSVNLLGRVLRGEIKSLKSFTIWAGSMKGTWIPPNQPESILSMNGKTGETSVLKRLDLLLGSNDLCKVLLKDLFLCLRGNTSLIHLDFTESKLDEETFRDLMELLQVNLTLREIDVSSTSWARDGKAALIDEAVKQNQKRAVYMSVFREAKLTFGDAKAGRLFICGSPLAGLRLQSFSASGYNAKIEEQCH
ncbi:hypothetical protein AXG93_131s1330 [Marchantia polymorpha subsp. ruderalis]|uniref:FBD domain-containing protein n=1 Tax=Marchantia polymorpha subsp. ruderalis TaxID=1480154 RepID=A0A176W1D4_MARPO|nr:hypothetical protein AXG93_131s1330 [Marchantia polymorpha subsp. ruderalis]